MITVPFPQITLMPPNLKESLEPHSMAINLPPLMARLSWLLQRRKGIQTVLTAAARPETRAAAERMEILLLMTITQAAVAAVIMASAAREAIPGIPTSTTAAKEAAMSQVSILT